MCQSISGGYNIGNMNEYLIVHPKGISYEYTWLKALNSFINACNDSGEIIPPEIWEKISNRKVSNFYLGNVSLLIKKI